MGEPPAPVLDRRTDGGSSPAAGSPVEPQSHPPFSSQPLAGR